MSDRMTEARLETVRFHANSTIVPGGGALGECVREIDALRAELAEANRQLAEARADSQDSQSAEQNAK